MGILSSIFGSVGTKSWTSHTVSGNKSTHRTYTGVREADRSGHGGEKAGYSVTRDPSGTRNCEHYTGGNSNGKNCNR